MQLSYQIFTSPMGEILVAGTDYAISHVRHGYDKNQLGVDFRMDFDNVSPFDRTGYIRDACEAIGCFLRGETQRIDLAVEIGGTEFQRKVWHALREIPYGETTSYSAIAESIGAADSFRAVANACGNNPIPLIIPCHRVVHKNGEIGGFGWGDDAKRFLLDLEKAHARALQANAG